MKKLFTSTLLLAASLLAATPDALATDRIVARNGAGGAYSTIAAAITAAADNDRIVITPDVVPFGENLTITKSLTFVSNVEGTYYSCAGTWTINPATAGKRVTIIGLRLLSGDITTGINAPAGVRTRVEILNSVLRNGDISFNANNYDMTVAADSVIGTVSFRYGRVVGNYLSSEYVSSAVALSTDGVATTDSIWVVGNRIKGPNTNNSSTVNLTSSSQYVYCVNNLLFLNYSNLYNYGFYMNATKSVGTGMNTFANNTIVDLGNQMFSSSRYALYLQSPPLNTQVVGNVVTGVNNGSGAQAVQQSGGVNNYIYAYNYLRGLTSGVSVANNGTNKTNSNTAVNTTTGALIGGSDAINGNDPDATYTDLDLSRGDAGAYGGSYSLTNFHPFVSATPASNQGGRVYLVKAKRRILQGGSLRVEASGFDR